MWWRWWRRDEELLIRLWGVEMLVGGGYFDLGSKVHTDLAVEDNFSVECLSDEIGRRNIVEGNYNTTKRLEWTPTVDCDVLVDEVTDGLEVVRFEYFWIV